ncbi:GrpB family protein [Alteribacillus bidgolensis]|uniref:GrpB domain, predicted nucleotidyltransferase, UPF0157 family n=1 Tax=Alteribacillus bidgolensis TaxID=930129 RepID=A0A1G8QPR5_9BACI|nr:GrpB family protein [Alteribacillus bidgolensis]SDJ06658.1 GrpB domain, predicted nucleotidyltransferase, UPF0157 family [Alteribacillus bidgolensis]
MVGEEIMIVKYNPNWVEDFEREKSRISTLFGTQAIVIEHVGSTSIPGQEAKPVIDIFVIVSPFKDLAYYKSLFNFEVYNYIQTDMSKRYLFNKYTNGIWTHNLHINPYNNEFYTRNELLFRDYLREHPELVREYGEIKKNVAKNFAGEFEEYTRSKTEFIQKVIDAARTKKGLPLQNVWTNELK